MPKPSFTPEMVRSAFEVGLKEVFNAKGYVIRLTVGPQVDFTFKIIGAAFVHREKYWDDVNALVKKAAEQAGIDPKRLVFRNQEVRGPDAVETILIFGVTLACCFK